MATTLQARNLSIALTANDLERSLRFYTDGLGFTVDQREEADGKLQGVMLKAGDAWLGLSQDDFAKGRNRTKGIGMSLYFETEQDIRLAVHWVLARKDIFLNSVGDVALLPKVLRAAAELADA